MPQGLTIDHYRFACPKMLKTAGTKVKPFRHLGLLSVAYCLLMLFPSKAFSQDAPVDSTSEKFNKQATENQRATGMDTTPVLPPDTSGADTLKKKSVQKFGIHTNSKRKFYWNAANYPTNDSSLAAKKLRRHSPLYAALFSAACPGLGQAYNRKYWKIPIVYAGLGGLGYAVYYTASNFVGYRAAYRAQVADVPDPYASYKGVDDPATLKEYRDYFKKNLDISAICTGVWYILNIVDAAVDAHLFEWNMKDDIHLSWQPVMMNNYSQASTAPGVRLNLNF
jgi:hypothetical protein